MRNSTINKLQNELDNIRFFAGRYDEKHCPILKEIENEGCYEKDQRRQMQNKIDYINEIQEQIIKLQEKQEQLKKEFYQEYDHHFEMMQPL